jgi:hypothetical protein
MRLRCGEARDSSEMGARKAKKTRAGVFLLGLKTESICVKEFVSLAVCGWQVL